MSGENSPRKTLHKSQEDRLLREVRSASKKYSCEAKQARDKYVRVGLCTAAFSSLVPVAAATSSPRWIMAVLGAMVVTGHGFLALTSPHEHAIHYERASSMLHSELFKFEYRSKSDKVRAWEDFVTRVAEIEGELVQQETTIDKSGIRDPQSQEDRTVNTDGSERTRTRGRPSDPSPASA
jgi:hypothetical protein